MDEENNDLINQESSSETTTNVVVENNNAVEQATENIEPVLTEPTKTPLADNITEETKPKSKKKLIIILVSTLIVIILAVVIILLLVKKGDNSKSSFKDPFVNFDTDGFSEVSGMGENTDVTQGKIATHTNIQPIQFLNNSLKEDYNSGRITADQYVMNALYSIYDSSKLDSKYRSLIASSDMIDEVVNFVGDYGDKLSEETIIYFFQKVYLSNIDKQNIKQTSSINNVYTTELLGSKPGDVSKLDSAVLSSKKHFIVYYTANGKNATTKKYAENVANILEYAVDAYKKAYGCEYKFELNSFYQGVNARKLLNNNIEVLERCNIDPSLISTTMPVYIIDFSGSIVGKYNDDASFNDFLRILAKISPVLCKAIPEIIGDCDRLNSMDEESKQTVVGALASIYLAPNFMMDNDADENELKVIAMHELFHHYQHTHICNGVQCYGDSFPSEPAANLAVIQNLSIDKIGDSTLNGHSYVFTRDIANGVDKVEGAYSAYVFAYNYANIVEDGAKKFFNSQRSGDPLRYLEEQSGGKYKDAMLKTVEGIMTLNYKNKYLVPYYSGTILYPTQYAEVNYSDNFNLNKNINKSSAHFYYINKSQMNSMENDTQLTIKDPERSSNNIQRMYVLVFIKAKSNSPYVLYYNQTFDNEFVMNPKDFAEYEEIVYAVVNTNFGTYGSYDLVVEKHGTKPKSIRFPEVLNPGISDEELAKARSIYCKKAETSSFTQTSEVLVNYKDNRRISDLYVKETLDASELDKSSPSYNLAKSLLDISMQGIEQLFNMYFSDAKTIYSKNDDKYTITVKIPKAYFDNLGDVYDFEGNKKIDIINGLTEEGFTCYLKH